MTWPLGQQLGGNENGNTAVEFALIAPALLMLTFGLLNLALLFYSSSSLHFAVQDTARCASIQTTTCVSDSAIKLAGEARYYGPKINPVFTHVMAACGHLVTGTATYDLQTGIKTFSIPLSASACFP